VAAGRIYRRGTENPDHWVLGTGDAAVASSLVAAFVGRLRELGWVEGHNVIIEYCRAEGRSDRYAEIANEFAAPKVDLIVTWDLPR
jgi:hypothetical protein